MRKIQEPMTLKYFLDFLKEEKLLNQSVNERINISCDGDYIHTGFLRYYYTEYSNYFVRLAWIDIGKSNIVKIFLIIQQEEAGIHFALAMKRAYELGSTNIYAQAMIKLKDKYNFEPKYSQRNKTESK